MARKGFGFRMEDLQEEVNEETVVADETPVAEEPVVEYEEDEIEQGDESDVVDEAMDQVEEVTEGLESIKEMMLSALADGGMTKQSAMFADQAIKGTVGNWVKLKQMPAMESFDEAGGRMQATGYALENIEYALEGAWDKIVSLAARWADSAVSLFRKLASNAEALSKKAKALSARAQGHEGTPVAKSFKVNKAMYRNLARNGSVKDIDGSLEHIAKVLDAAKNEGPIGKILESLSADIAGIDTKDPAKAVEHFEGVAAKHSVDAAVKQFEAATPLKFTRTGDESADLNSEELVGGRVINVTFKAGYDGMVAGVTASLKGGKAVKGEELEALSAAEIVKLAKSIEDLAEGIVASSKAMEARKAQLKAFTTETGKITKSLKSSGVRKAGVAVAAAGVLAGAFIAGLPAAAAAAGKGAIYKGLTAKGAAIAAGAAGVGAAGNGVAVIGTKVDRINAQVRAYCKASNRLAQSIMQPDLLIQRQALASGKAAYNYGVKALNNLKVGQAEESAEA